jgi:hypothetical protein
MKFKVHPFTVGENEASGPSTETNGQLSGSKTLRRMQSLIKYVDRYVNKLGLLESKSRALQLQIPKNCLFAVDILQIFG